VGAAVATGVEKAVAIDQQYGVKEKVVRRLPSSFFHGLRIGFEVS